jgi:hypothetical protein
MSFGNRLQLIADMADEAECGILTVSPAIYVERSTNSSDSFFEIVVRQPGSEILTLTSRTLILATGRFGPLEAISGFYPSVFRRLEVGVRIQQPTSRSFFASLPGADPKLKLLSSSDSAEWRTFCACRGGETVVTQTSGYWSVSGRADGPPTGYSNIGFNVRLLDASVAEHILPGLLGRLRGQNAVFRIPLAEFMSRQPSALMTMEGCFGSRLSSLIHRGLAQLMRSYPDAATDATLIGPTVEGIGGYPVIGHDLQVPDMPCWVAGDATGIFRGIIAAMVSGYYVGLAVRQRMAPAKGEKLFQGGLQ